MTHKERAEKFVNDRMVLFPTHAERIKQMEEEFTEVHAEARLETATERNALADGLRAVLACQDHDLDDKSMIESMLDEAREALGIRPDIRLGFIPRSPSSTVAKIEAAASTIKCDCGADKTNTLPHSRWCPATVIMEVKKP